MFAHPLARLTAGARLLVLLTLGAPLLWARDANAVLALVGIAAVWFVAQVCFEVPRLHRWADPVAEAACVGILVGIAVHNTVGVAAALCVAPFIGGLRRGVTGVGVTTATELVAVVVINAAWYGDLSTEVSQAIFTWIVVGVGLGFIASYVRGTTQALHTDDELRPYLEAQKLLRELVGISSGLSSGLDPNALSGQLVGALGDRLPISTATLYVPRGEVLVPLIGRGSGLSDLEGEESLALEAWARTTVLINSRAFAFPFGNTAVVGAGYSPDLGLSRQHVSDAIDALRTDLAPLALQLDTALLFMEFRDNAAADVRKRLAREMHDGIAQDIASLGYLVDALAARPADDKQAEQFAMLRDRITAIVAEVRQSVLTLRTSIGESESLGAAISTVARHLSESSGIPITVTLDEHATRLRSEVEAELFRIAQEAMNNAIKHARCTNIEVHCEVKAPSARITVSDNGVGLQRARSDSHGLKIMRERARLVHGELSIADRPEGGLAVAVEITGRA